MLLLRFRKSDLERLCSAQHLPDKYICNQGTAATGMEALFIMLRRLTYPNRWCDLAPVFGRAEPELSIIFDKVNTCFSFDVTYGRKSNCLCISVLPHITDDIYECFSHLLQSLDLVWLDCAAFAAAISAKGAPLHQCWGFIDGTARPIARPIRS